MQMSPELQKMYEENRCKMLELNRKFRMLFWFSVILSALWFCTSALVGIKSTMDETYKGPFKFYAAIGTGTAQILYAILSFILGYLSSERKRVPSLIALGIYIVSLVLVMGKMSLTLAGTSIGMLTLGIGLHIWAQTLFIKDNELKEMPGYPLFSVEADTPAEFEASKVVKARAKNAGGEMETIGGPAASSSLRKPSLPEQLEQVQLSDLYKDRVPGQAPPKLGPISLETQQVQQKLPAVTTESLVAFEPEPQKNDAAAVPEIPDVQIEISDDLSAGRRIYQPHEEMLPDAAEVRRRLAAMKQAREQQQNP
ncbi:MAG: hypothetical protein IKI58_01545 [Oscillospiraceae bacterium]|nr:hypothetical protein [Oscillospiraceae bacterium]